MEKIYTEGERLQVLINALEGGNQSRFADKCKIARSTVTRIKDGVLSLKVQADKIIAVYPQVSREWLVTGVGYPGDISLDIARVYYEKIIHDRNETIHILSKEIEMQQEEIESLRSQLKK